MSKVLALDLKISFCKELITSAQDADMPDMLLIKSYEVKIAALKEELITEAIRVAETPTIDPLDSKYSQKGSYFDAYSKAQLNANLVSQLPHFSGTNPEEVSNFITRCKQLQRSTYMNEKVLISIIKGKFGPNAFSTLEQFEAEIPITTLEALYAFIKSNWSLHLSVFQLLESTYALDKKSEESWPTFNSRLQSSFSKVKFAHNEFVRNSLDVAKPTIDDVFDLLQSHVIMNRLHRSNEDLYRVITCEQSSLKTHTILSQRVQTLETQGLYQSSSVLYNNSAQNQIGQGESESTKIKNKGLSTPQLGEAELEGNAPDFSDSDDSSGDSAEESANDSSDDTFDECSEDEDDHSEQILSDRQDESLEVHNGISLAMMCIRPWSLSDDE